MLGGEMRQNEANLAITDHYSKRKMTWVIIAAEWMGFVHIRAVPSEVLCPARQRLLQMSRWNKAAHGS